MGRESSDAAFIRRALELARRGEGHTRPNPAVGAVAVKDGRIVGEGWHRRAGGDHAEVAAIGSARRRLGIPPDRPLEGVSLYVTLEPCSRPGRVGACTDAIAKAGLERVVYGADDPNPKNRGRARRALAKAGIVCTRIADSAVRRSCDELIAGFAKHIRTGLPLVIVKLALSLDGRICDVHGNAKWISSARSRTLTGELRTMCDAIMVGAETVRRDDPSLLCHSRRNDDLVRVVVSRSGKLPRRARVFTDGAPNQTLVYRDAVEAIRDLGRRGLMSVVCEGGLALATSLAEAGLVDRWIAVLAPLVIGGRPIAKAIRGTVAENESFVRFGDGFLTVDFGRKAEC